MKTLKTLAIAVIVALIAVSCTQYQIIPIPMPDTGKSDTITVSTTADFLSAVLSAEDGDTIIADNVSMPSSCLGTMSIANDISINGSINLTDSVATGLAASTLSTRSTGKALFSIIGGATVDFSDLTVNVADSVADLVSAIVSVDNGGITANGFTVTTSEEKTVVGIYIGASVKAKDVSISASVSVNIEIDEENEEAPSIVDKVETSLPYDASTPEEYTTALTDYKKVRLTADFDITSFGFQGGNTYDVYLNEHTLTVNTENNASISPNVTAAFYNGSINLTRSNWASSSANLAIWENAKLILDNVDIHGDASTLYPAADNATLIAKNGTSITADGAFAVATNAAEPPASVSIDLTDTTLKADASAICFNIDGIINLTRCNATSNHVVALIRGGKATIKDSTLASNGTYIAEEENPAKPVNMDYYFDGTWGSGTYVAYATLVVGNRISTAYKYPADVTISNTTLSMKINDGINNDAKTLYIANVGEYATTFTTDNQEQADYIIDGAYFGDDCTVICNGVTTKLPANESASDTGVDA